MYRNNLSIFLLAIVVVFQITSKSTLVVSTLTETRCVDKIDFSFVVRKKTRSCKWLSNLRKMKKKQRLCNRRRIRKGCRQTCNFRKCRDVPSIAPSTQPSTSPSDQPSLGSEVYFSGKKGTCWLLRPQGKPGSYIENLPKVWASNPYWAYSWGPSPPVGVPTKKSESGGLQIITENDKDHTDAIDFIPMLWGYYDDLFESYTDTIISQDPKIILGFNEPDSDSQSNIAVERAIDGWKRLVEKISTGKEKPSRLLLVSPSCQHPLGSWMTSFMERVAQDNLRVDAIGVHHYGGANPRAFQDKMKEIYEFYGLPIVITEFAVADWEATSVETNRFSEERVLAFQKEVLPWMESQDWILGYSWFSFNITNKFGTTSALVYEETLEDNTGKTVLRLTPLGKFYSEFSTGELGSKERRSSHAAIVIDADKDASSTQERYANDTHLSLPSRPYFTHPMSMANMILV